MKEKDILKNADNMIKSFEIHRSGAKCTFCFYRFDKTCMFDMLQDFYKLSKVLKNENQGLSEANRQMAEYIKKLETCLSMRSDMK